ncbi:MAG: TetR/AcrR family transcriptional regulator [Pseudomonadota bacterium]
MKVIEEKGVEQLSMREVARRLGVSHQAPYKHFESRDHIVAEIVARAFKALAEALDARPRSGDPGADLHAMGVAYLEFAARHPLQYSLMYSAGLPDASLHEGMLSQSHHAYRGLLENLRALPVNASDDRDEEAAAAKLHADAMFIVSALHGLANLSSSGMLQKLSVPRSVHQNAVELVLERIGGGIGKA